MALNLPELAKIDYTSLDFDSIITLVNNIVENHPDYFVEIDDFKESNAARMVIELVAYVVDLLADRVDWVANELTLPTVTQKQNGINLLKLINYRFSLPQAAAVTVTASITGYIDPFALNARYSVPARDLNGNLVNFELLNKNDDGKIIYEGVDSTYEFDTGYLATPILSHNDLIFYEGTSYREFFTMQGVNNEFVELSRTGVQEGSVRVWRVTRTTTGTIVTKRELTEVTSFISPEAQDASDLGLPPYKLLVTESDGVFIQFGETPVVTIFNSSGTEEIMVWYRTTTGADGNITARAINYTTTILVNGQNVQVNFINSIAASGGANSETLENAKRYGPLALTTANKTVNPQDFVVLLQEFDPLMNSITYGKSNEPDEIFNDYGYHIPPYEAWIYSIFNKSGWPSFPTYAYPQSFKVGRPYAIYGPVDKELIRFGTYAVPVTSVELEKIKYYAKNDDYSNVKVTSLKNRATYTPGVDYVIDLEGRQITKLSGGAINDGATVLVQYYENDQIDDYITINFATGDTQDIPREPIYTGSTTYAWSLDTETVFSENNLSLNDYNYPNGDYYIDYLNSQIVRNPTYPILDSKETFTADAITGADILGGVNNEFILSIDGLNRTAYNSDHDFKIDAFNGWATAGNGSSVTYVPTTSYSFFISIDGGEFVEYYVPTVGGTSPWDPWELAIEIWDNAIDVATSSINLSDQGIVVFADAFTSITSPKLTFMSTTEGPTSAVELASGTTYTDLFGLVNLDLTEPPDNGEEIDIIELARRCRATLNTLGLCTGYIGQTLPAGKEEEPEVLSRANVLTPSAFTLTASTDSLDITIAGSGSDGTYAIVFNTVVSNSPYDLDVIQKRFDLIRDMQTDIDGVIGSNVVQVFWLRQKSGYYRIGFRLLDTSGGPSPVPSITIEEPASDSARLIFNFGDGQSSLDDNLLEAKVSPESNMVDEFYLRFELLGAFGEEAFIQTKANNALHNNTLELLKYGDDQYARGTKILSGTLISENDLISDGGLLYTFYDTGVGQNNEFNLAITSTPSGFTDGDYVIIITAGTYNITDLIEEINNAFTIAELSGTPTDISSFIVCEKQEGENKIRIRMTDYDTAATDPPDVEINNDNDATIGTKAVDKLGFRLNQMMSESSTILLHYAGDWISDSDSDTSEEASIFGYLEDSKLICQDYIVKDPMFNSFDVKGTVYCAKGFDRSIIEDEVKTNINSVFSIDQREFAEPAAISSILKEINKVEGVEYAVVNYFGKDYQLYYKYTNDDRPAIITANEAAQGVVARWSDKSAFKVTIDGSAMGGVNLDGEYIVIVGNSWTDRDYDDLLDKIINGDGSTGGLANAVPLAMGKTITNLATVINTNHSSGIFRFETVNEGPAVMLKIEDPESAFTYGYQTFIRTANFLESEYTFSTVYSLVVNIDGTSYSGITVTSPSAGVWYLEDIASDLYAIMSAVAIVAIDEEGKIRITSTLGGNRSTVSITSGTLLAQLEGADTAVDGTSGYVSCVNEVKDGTLHIGNSVTAYGLPEEPTVTEYEEMYNYMNEIPANYDEILYISEDYYVDGGSDLLTQRHGIILSFVEVGK